MPKIMLKKPEANEVMQAFADCLRIIYNKAGIDTPSEFDPELEAARLIAAIKGK